MLCLIYYLLINYTQPIMAQQQQEQPEFIQGKLEIKEIVGEWQLYPEIKESMNNLLSEWTHNNYQEILPILYENEYTEYEESKKLCNILWTNLILNDPASSLNEFVLNSGIIQNYRISIYLYCCQELNINQDQIDQDPEDIFDINNNEQMTYSFLLSYPQEILVNEFIEIRDAPVLK